MAPAPTTSTAQKAEQPGLVAHVALEGGQQRRAGLPATPHPPRPRPTHRRPGRRPAPTEPPRPRPASPPQPPPYRCRAASVRSKPRVSHQRPGGGPLKALEPARGDSHQPRRALLGQVFEADRLGPPRRPAVHGRQHLRCCGDEHAPSRECLPPPDKAPEPVGPGAWRRNAAAARAGVRAGDDCTRLCGSAGEQRQGEQHECPRPECRVGGSALSGSGVVLCRAARGWGAANL